MPATQKLLNTLMSLDDIKKPENLQHLFWPSPDPEGPLGPIDIEVTGGAGTFRLAPNESVLLGMARLAPFGEPLKDVPSEVSGQPAYRVRTSEAELKLTPEEVIRLWRRDLEPNEYFVLVGTHGDIYEIHDDFYDPATGVALQPQTAG